MLPFVKSANVEIHLDNDRIELADGLPNGAPIPVLSGKIVLTSSKNVGLVDLTLSVQGVLDCDATVLNLVNDVIGTSPVHPVSQSILSYEKTLWRASPGKPAVAPTETVSTTSSPVKSRELPGGDTVLLGSQAPNKGSKASTSTNGELPAGRREWPFSFKLPSTLLPSVNTRYGRVSYILKARLKRKGLGLDFNARRTFTVVRTRSRGAASFGDFPLEDKTALFSGMVTMPTIAFCDDPTLRVKLNLKVLEPNKVRDIRSVKCYVKEVSGFCHEGQFYENQTLLGSPSIWKPADEPPSPVDDSDEHPFALARTMVQAGQKQKLVDTSAVPFTVSTVGANMDFDTPHMRIYHLLKVKVDYEPWGADLGKSPPLSLPGNPLSSSSSTSHRKVETCVMQIPLPMWWASSRRPQSWLEGLPTRTASEKLLGVSKSRFRLRNSSEPVELLTRRVHEQSPNRPIFRKTAESSPALYSGRENTLERSNAVRGKKNDVNKALPSRPDSMSSVTSGQWTLDETGVYTFKMEDGTATSSGLDTVFEEADDENADERENKPPQTQVPASDKKQRNRQSAGFYTSISRDDGNPVYSYNELALSESVFTSGKTLTDSPIAVSVRESGKWELDAEGVYTFV
ncbi:uncharacterized protein SPPG_08739 [Spizellomyces punctatus DAOM BR117]|uniref:Arrestin-like N-terminal domain-containing protein n=1 Tax=Spizellomyces punctatus (strain DAOM BR117) TaxID=645134 RepID=A0A0L0H335_SPIPD|nr:uncharacterized protein SPPG_08739 [Spizellomyces punctatus DAOM BR117]KNC95875.1 hypothetical protein SPPG_08739 [Spizellomyces punctatus DAOM BR117]|eukprot:XP_016603915.1 hypothetical protein SPPG_08739 [Spizellomyces punctatus DAOM BR117]